MPLGMKAMKAIKPAGKKAAAAAPTKKTMNAMKVVDFKPCNLSQILIGV